VAIAESDGPTALNGGDLGWRKTSDLPSLFVDILPDLEKGQVSEPARSPAGFHILTVYDKRGGEQQTEQQSKVRHILVKPSAILSDEEAKAKLEKLRQRVLNGEDFAALAKEHSEDIGSMLSGGDLGWSRPGMFVAEFESVMAKMKEGEISEPFRSQFGWHILQVQERRQEDITDDVLRDKAARILTSRRFEDELQIWLREMRDEAYVDIKLDTQPAS
jgi:peptidyl-prolyl cis-trans isomerase SurA